ncbi:MAG TPA: FkbM family methyltransferase [Nitrospirae bacterium]|nr:FkbM family methyltransferase [Nitrospirota bacterium]
MEKTLKLPDRFKTFWYLSKAPSLNDKLSVIGFFLKRLFSISADDELKVKIGGGLIVHFLPSQGELRPYNDIFLNDGFDRYTDFAPENCKVVFDCGANIGLFTLRAALNRKTEVFSFEPNPAVFKRLLKNIDENRLDKVRPLQAAVGSACKKAAFSSASSSPTGKIQEETGGADNESVEVEIVTLDSVTDRFGLSSIDLIKLDIEGHEYEALLGAENTLARTGRLVLEYHGEELRDKCGSFLIDKGFEMIHEIPGYQFYENRSSADRPAGVN